MFDDGLSHDEIVDIATKNFNDQGYDKPSESVFALLVEVAAAYVVQLRTEASRPAHGLSDLETALQAVMENLEEDERVI